MASATWPASLPQDLLLDGLEIQFPTGGSRSNIDHPLTQQRERYNATVTFYESVMELTVAQYTTLITFWADTLGYGSLPFNWTHPITEETVEVRFKVSSPPEFSGVGGTGVYVNLALEILP